MKLSQKLYIGIWVALLVGLFTVPKSSAQITIQDVLDPAHVTKILGGVEIGDNQVSFVPPNFSQIPQFLQNIPGPFALSFLNPIGGALAAEIRSARMNVRNSGCADAPEEVTIALAPFMPNTVFDGVCWAVVRPGISLDSFAIKDGRARAITLVDTIVFDNEADGHDPVLWAHELTHVLQYRRLSIEGFANIYTYDYNRLEGEAYGFQDFVAARINVQEGDAIFQERYFKSGQAWKVTDPMTGEAWAAQARRTIDPQKCIRIQGVNFVGGTSVQVFNNCEVKLVVVSFVVHNVQTGQQYEMPCEGNCEVQSGLYNGGIYGAFADRPGFLTDYVNLRWF